MLTMACFHSGFTVSVTTEPTQISMKLKTLPQNCKTKHKLQSTLMRLFQPFLILYQQLFNSSFYKRNETNGGRNHIAEGI